MIVVNSKKELLIELNQFKQNTTIGLVPTMGALHEGHLSLVQSSTKKCDVTIATIFVNPRQFDKESDLVNYPNLLEEDLKFLEDNNCSIVYVPSVEDVYSDYNGIDIDLTSIDQVMEGKHRDGHFKGVADIIYFLFDLIKPTHAFFGLKDFQQVCVVRYLTSELGLETEVVACETIREENGLAKSSRNLRVSKEGQDNAKVIFHVLSLAKEWKFYFSPVEVISMAQNMIEEAGLTPEYISIVDPNNLKDLTTWQDPSHMCLAAHCEGIRLIDNMELS